MTIQVRVLFFGMLKDLAELGTDTLSLPEGATVSDVLDHYSERIGSLKNLLPSIAISVNQEYAGAEVKLKTGDEIALLPPVSGGVPRAYIVLEKIDTQATLEGVKQPEDGAAIAFEGVVRNNTRGRHTLYLDYEAYEEMALKQMEGLIAQACSQF